MTPEDINQWAMRHHVSAQAMAELRQMLVSGVSAIAGLPGSEASVSSAIQLEAGKRGDIILWRNNVGALRDDNGRVIRYGLANVSKAMNDRIKSADHIGIYRRIIQPPDVGSVIGQFLSIESKREDWRPDNSPRCLAQTAWGVGVTAWGGVALTHASSALPAFSSLPLGATQ